MRWILTVTVLLGLACTVHANPFEVWGVTGDSVGMAGAYTALSDNAAGAFYNPGAPGLMPREDVEFGFLRQHSELEFNGREPSTDPAQGMILATSTRVGEHGAFTTNFFFPRDRVIRVRSQDPRTPFFTFYDNYPQRLAIFLAGSYELIPDTLSLGVGVQLLADISGGIIVDFPFVGLQDVEKYGADDPCQYVDSPDCELAPGDVPTEGRPRIFFDETLDFSFRANAGLLWQVTDRLRAGLAFRDRFKLNVDIPETVTTRIAAGGVSLPPIPLETSVAMDTFYTPRHYVLGLAWSPDFDARRDTWKLALDIDYAQWSDYISDELVLQVFNPEDLENLNLGAIEIPLAVIPSQRIDPDFEDTINIRLGYQRLHEHLRWSAGYAWVPSPVPDQTGVSNFLDNDRHVLALAAGCDLGWIAQEWADTEISLYGQLHYLPERTYTKREVKDYIGREVGLAVDEEGNPLPLLPSNLVVKESGRPDGELGGTVFALGASVRFVIE